MSHMVSEIIIDLLNVSREEVSELEKYLESNCWKWERKEYEKNE